MVYPSKQDWWVILAFGPGVVIGLGVGLLLVFVVIVQGAPPALLLASLVPLGVAGLLLWILFSTGYEIRPSDLIVRSGPVRWTIPFCAIAEIEARRRWTAELAWNFGLSQDRLYIRCLKRNGQPALLGVTISPQDQEGFLRELAQAMAEQDAPKPSSR